MYSDFKILVDLSIADLKLEAILHRLVKKVNKVIPQVLVKLSHLPEASATWEDWYALKKSFPVFVACGQATYPVGGGVTATVEDCNYCEYVEEVRFVQT